MDLNDLVPDRRPSGFWIVLRRVGTIVGALLVVVGILSLVGQGGSLHEAKYLLMVGGVILVVAQMVGRV
jgi:hypothetical protein